jgi:hypothetical protein
MTVVLFFIPIFAIFSIVALVAWLALALIIVIHSAFGSLTGFAFLPLCLSVLSALPSLLHPHCRLPGGIIGWATLVVLGCLHCFIEVF